MKKTKRRYAKPQVTSQKTFEQAALACVAAAIPGAPAGNTNLKNNSTSCGFSSS